MADRIIYDPSESDQETTRACGSVISLADVRLARGWSRPSKVCEHKNLVYSSSDRRIECKSCDQPVEAFDAFMVLTRHFDSMESAARSREARTKEALSAVIIRRAAKAFDKAWGRKLAPCCPHCRAGLLPEDFAEGAQSSMGRDYEIARRKRDLEHAHQPPQTDTDAREKVVEAVDEDWVRGLIGEAIVMSADDIEEGGEENCRIAEAVLIAVRPYLAALKTGDA